MESLKPNWRPVKDEVVKDSERTRILHKMWTTLDKECNPSFKELYTQVENTERDPQEPD